MTAESISRPANKCSQGRGKSSKTLELIETIETVFDEFDGSMSTRQVFYQCVSRGVVENTVDAYGKVQRLLVEMRRKGLVDYDRVVDRTRGMHKRPGWDGVADLLDAGAAQYRRDLWVDQKTDVMIACEKQALEGIFAEVVDEFGASLWICRGYASESFVFEWANEIKRINRDKPKGQVEIIYFGDHDPSGLGIENDTFHKLIDHGATFDWHRGGLLEEDFDQYKLINVPVKRSDTRARRYLQIYGDRAAELDALPPDVLRTRIQGAILKRIDADVWSRLKRTEAVERESLRMVSKNWPAAVNAVSP